MSHRSTSLIARTIFRASENALEIMLDEAGGSEATLDVRLLTFHNFKLNIARTVRSGGCFFLVVGERLVTTHKFQKG